MGSQPGYRDDKRGSWLPAGAGMTDCYKLAKIINFSNNKRET